MLENLSFWRNKHGNRAHRALEGSAAKIVPIVPTNRSQSFQSCPQIVHIVPIFVPS